MHSGHSSVIEDRFLIDDFPRMHMVLYNSVTSVRGFSEKAAVFLSDLKEKGDSMITEEAWKGEERLMARRGFALLASLYKKGYNAIVRQYSKGLTYEPFDLPIDGVVLQISPSSRWQKYDTTAVYDVILAVPSWGRIIAFSTTDMVSEIDPASISRYERMRIKNFHFYSFFNRAHGVRGRQVVQEQLGKSGDIDFLRDFSFLLRTCADASMMGRSFCLPIFTPVVTVRGLQLGFYFAVLCKVRAVEPIRAAGGFGTNLGMTRLTLSDGIGEFKADLSTKIFSESLSLACNKLASTSLNDPLNLRGYSGWVLALAAWLFGQELPHIAAVQLLGDRSDVADLMLEATMNTQRKMHVESLAALTAKAVDNTEQVSKNIVVSDGWAYYKQSHWSAQVFLALLRNKFGRLGVSDALRTGTSIAYCRTCEQLFRSFVRLNPDALELYISDDPKTTLQGLFPHDPKGNQLEDDPLAGLYKCMKCKMAFKESQFQLGKMKICTKCGSMVVPFEEKEERTHQSNGASRRVRASRFLGSDDWLKSLFD